MCLFCFVSPHAITATNPRVQILTCRYQSLCGRAFCSTFAREASRVGGKRRKAEKDPQPCYSDPEFRPLCLSKILFPHACAVFFIFLFNILHPAAKSLVEWKWEFQKVVVGWFEGYWGRVMPQDNLSAPNIWKRIRLNCVGQHKGIQLGF